METMVRIHAVDSATLTPLVRQALLSGDSEVIAWQVAPMHGGFGGGSGVSNLHRFTGSARDGDRIVPWSLVLKILRWTNGRAGSTGWQDWRREAEAYQSGLLRRLPGDLKAPRCFGAIEYPGEGIGSGWRTSQAQRLPVGHRRAMASLPATSAVLAM